MMKIDSISYLLSVSPARPRYMPCWLASHIAGIGRERAFPWNHHTGRWPVDNFSAVGGLSGAYILSNACSVRNSASALKNSL